MMNIEIGTAFIDPYLGVEDIVWEVNADLEDGYWLAEIISGPESVLGLMDAYEGDHIRFFAR
jgi:hypothetical protein